MEILDGYVDGSIESIYHLGLVAGIFDSLQIGTIADNVIPKKRPCNLSHGQVLKAMVLNGLGFTERRLYLFPKFFNDLAVENLLGDGVRLEHLNDDVIGRTLDAVYEYGATRLFNEIVVQSLINDEFAAKLIHVDTTNFSVYGKYNRNSDNTLNITKGYPKDGRWDLNRFVLGIATNQVGIPLFAEAFSGNKQDSDSIIEMIQNFQKSLKFDEKVYYIADAAFYSEDNIKQISETTFWISRAKGTINEVINLTKSDVEMSDCGDERYSCFETVSSYGNVEQKWVMYEAKARVKTDLKKIEEKLKKKAKKAKNEISRLMNQEFSCQEDAEKAINKWIVKNPMFGPTTYSLISKNKRENGKKGRPKADEKLKKVFYIRAKLLENSEIIEGEKLRAGRFVLATNDLKLNADELLSNYKNQNTVEKGFRFIKDKQFLVSEVFLKKEERIEALAALMAICLFVYGVAEFRLRKRLIESGESVPNQKDKPTNKPTLKWVFFLFRRVREITIMNDGKPTVKIQNFNSDNQKVAKLLGSECEKYYRDRSTCGM